MSHLKRMRRPTSGKDGSQPLPAAGAPPVNSPSGKPGPPSGPAATAAFLVLRTAIVYGAWAALGGRGARGTLVAWALTLSYARHLLWALWIYHKPHVLPAVVASSVGLGVFVALLAYGTTDAPLEGPALGAGALLFFAGSALTTTAEIQRRLFKREAAGGGARRPFSGGLYGVARHINYTGEVLGWAGLALLSGSWWTLAIPAFMARNFAFVFIPKHTKANRETYGDKWGEYERAVPAKMVPGVY